MSNIISYYYEKAFGIPYSDAIAAQKIPVKELKNNREKFEKLFNEFTTNFKNYSDIEEIIEATTGNDYKKSHNKAKNHSTIGKILLDNFDSFVFNFPDAVADKLDGETNEGRWANAVSQVFTNIDYESGSFDFDELHEIVRNPSKANESFINSRFFSLYVPDEIYRWSIRMLLNGPKLDIHEETTKEIFHSYGGASNSVDAAYNMFRAIIEEYIDLEVGRIYVDYSYNDEWEEDFDTIEISFSDLLLLWALSQHIFL